MDEWIVIEDPIVDPIINLMLLTIKNRENEFQNEKNKIYNKIYLIFENTIKHEKYNSIIEDFFTETNNTLDSLSIL